KYVEEADRTSGKTVISQTDAGIEITNVRLLDETGLPTTRVELGQPMSFEIEYVARRPVRDCIFSIHLDRERLRVYENDSLSVGLDSGTLHGKGCVRCEIPNLALMPNSYSVHALVRDRTAAPLSH